MGRGSLGVCGLAGLGNGMEKRGSGEWGGGRGEGGANRWMEGR